MVALRIKKACALIAGLAVFPAVAHAESAAHGQFIDAQGSERGTVEVRPAPHGVLIHLEVSGLTPGWHAVHFHEKGSCTPDKFTSAGGHVHATTPVVHGFMNEKANDAGDLPNIYVGHDGSARAEFYSPLVSLKTAEGGRSVLLDKDGGSVVIHANPDDYQSQPIGGAGGRVACAVLKE